MEQGKLQRTFLTTPDQCGMTGRLSPLAPFTIFQALASEHAEQIGVGFAAMAKRREFWLTVHCRVEFYAEAGLLEELTGETWPEACEPGTLRCYRSYRLCRGETVVARGRTQWAILGPEGRVVPFGASGFPEYFPFPEGPAIDRAPQHFRDDFTEADAVFSYQVRSTDIDLGRHMNNVAYVRVLLGCLSAAELASGVAAMEVHYAAPCLEGEVLTVCCKREEKLIRLAMKKADGHHAVLGAIELR